MAGIRPFVIGAAALTLGAAAIAQQPQRPNIVSREVLPDGRVITRLWAPAATEVLLSGDSMGATAGRRAGQGFERRVDGK